MLYFVFLVLPYSLSLNVVAHDVIKRLARSVFISLCGFESAMDGSTSNAKLQNSLSVQLHAFGRDRLFMATRKKSDNFTSFSNEWARFDKC